MKFQKIVTEINNAFFRLESFMNGTIMDYQYFGFKEAFINLFTEARKHENFNYDNCKLIGKYFQLTEQIRIDTDKGDYENCEIAIDNKMFCKDCNEILYLNWERIEDFEEFLTPDEITESERKYSITDILKAPALPPQPIVKQKPIKYGANEYALTYIFDLYAIGQQVPINRIEGSFDAKKIKQDASKFPMYDKAPDTFYRAVKFVLEYDLNKPTDLQNISKDWLNAVRNLSTNWVITEQYLKDKNLIGE